MEIKELDKKQFILLTLLITFVVSIATGIVTVSLMNQVPKSVPQTINNVIQRTIEKVTTVEVPVPVKDNKDNKDTKDESLLSFNNNEDTLIPIYSKDTKIILDSSNVANTSTTNTENNIDNTNPTILNDKPIALGEGVIVSDIGLILVESNILTEDTLYKIVLEKEEFNASVLKKFGNGFTILKISVITDEETKKTEGNTETGNTPQ